MPASSVIAVQRPQPRNSYEEMNCNKCASVTPIPKPKPIYRKTTSGGTQSCQLRPLAFSSLPQKVDPEYNRTLSCKVVLTVEWLKICQEGKKRHYLFRVFAQKQGMLHVFVNIFEETFFIMKKIRTYMRACIVSKSYHTEMGNLMLEKALCKRLSIPVSLLRWIWLI